MSCKGMSLIAGAALVAAGFVGGSIVSSTLAQQYGDKDKETASHGDMDQQAMMEAWMKTIQPGKQHAKLAKGVGNWTVSMKHWMDPTAPPEESTGTTSFKMVLDGRYLVEDFHVTSMGMPFHGMGVTGYDNIDKKFKAVWFDNFGTGIMMMEGDANDQGGTTMYGSTKNPMTGQLEHVKGVSAQPDDNTVHFEMFKKTPEGGWMKEMEIHYTRAE